MSKRKIKPCMLSEHKKLAESVWNTSALGVTNQKTIQFPLDCNGIFNFNVNWGDGNNAVIKNCNSAIHTYSVAGIYRVLVTGIITGWNFAIQPAVDVWLNGDAPKLLAIRSFGPLKLIENAAGGYFAGCSNMNITATDVLDISNITTADYMFRGCSSLTTIPSINSRNTSRITTMSQFFAGAALFNQNLTGWDVSNVQFFAAMFLGASSFNGNISNWNTKSMTNAVQMFYGANAFNGAIGNWNTTSLVFSNEMFREAFAFNQDLSKWIVTQLQFGTGMFHAATSFNQKVGNWHVRQVKDLTRFLWATESFSTANYDNLWEGWFGKGIQFQSLVFFSSTCQYSCAPDPAAYARNNFTIDPLNWLIKDSGCQ